MLILKKSGFHPYKNILVDNEKFSVYRLLYKRFLIEMMIFQADEFYKMSQWIFSRWTLIKRMIFTWLKMTIFQAVDFHQDISGRNF